MILVESKSEQAVSNKISVSGVIILYIVLQDIPKERLPQVSVLSIIN
jgi:hypothetical protein